MPDKEIISILEEDKPAIESTEEPVHKEIEIDTSSLVAEEVKPESVVEIKTDNETDRLIDEIIQESSVEADELPAAEIELPRVLPLVEKDEFLTAEKASLSEEDDTSLPLPVSELELEEEPIEALPSTIEEESNLPEVDSTEVVQEDYLFEYLTKAETESTEDLLAELQDAIEEAYMVRSYEGVQEPEGKPQKIEQEEIYENNTEITSTEQLIRSPDTVIENVALKIIHREKEEAQPAKEALLAVVESISRYQLRAEDGKEHTEELQEIEDKFIEVLDALNISHTPESVELIVRSLIEQIDSRVSRAIIALMQEGAHESLQDNHLLRQLVHTFRQKIPLHLSLGRFVLSTTAGN